MLKAQPLYLQAYRSGLLDQNINRGRRVLKNCKLCLRECRVDRYRKPGTICGQMNNVRVSNYFPHFGEENCLVGNRGSGTIFFSGCNLHCVFCQNWQISQNGHGKTLNSADLAAIMLELQDMGCHNINLVTPTHALVAILESLPAAVDDGLRIPLVYNTGCYDSRIALKLIDGIVDIFLADVKFLSSRSAERYLTAGDYPEAACRNLKEMQRQVGTLHVDEEGIARRGLIVRHLVMPGHIDDARKIMNFIAREISVETAVNIMPQYRPEHRVNSKNYPEINRRITGEEYRLVHDSALQAGLHRLI